MSFRQPKIALWISRLVRMTFALVLLLFMLALWLWPTKALWTIEKQQLLGMAGKPSTLLTMSSDQQGYQLQQYVLATGALLRSQKLQVALDQERNQEEGDAFSWIPILSRNGAFLLGYRDDQLFVIDVEHNLRKVTLDTKIDGHDLLGGLGGLDALTISDDGRRVAADDSGTIYLWDATTGKLLFKLELPVETLQLFGTGLMGYRPGAIKFSRDGNYLGVTTKKRFVVVFNLQTKSEIGRIEGKVVPSFEFLAEGTLAISHGYGSDLDYRLYRIENQSLTDLNSPIRIGIEWVVGIMNDGIITGVYDDSPRLPKWLPGSIHKWWDEWRENRLTFLRLKWRKFGSSMPQHEKTIPIAANDKNKVFISLSNDGRFAIVQSTNNISAWSLTGWSWYRWLLFLLPLLLIVVIFRPRKVIPSGSDRL